MSERPLRLKPTDQDSVRVDWGGFYIRWRTRYWGSTSGGQNSVDEDDVEDDDGDEDDLDEDIVRVDWGGFYIGGQSSYWVGIRYKGLCPMDSRIGDGSQFLWCCQYKQPTVLSTHSISNPQ